MCPCYAALPMRRALVIVGKAPRAGSVKTRLSPPLSLEQAAELYEAFLLDTLETVRELGWERVCVVHPPGEAPSLTGSVDLLEQPAAGLARALSFAFEHHFAQGFDRVVLIGSDNPTLTVEPILMANRVLEEVDLAIGPTHDGGYYLIGMRQPWPRLFTQIEWSTPRVYAQTLQRAREMDLRVQAVQEWFDVDDAADLDHLTAELARLAISVAPHTRALLRGWYENPGLHPGASCIGLRDAGGNFAGLPHARQDHD